MQFAIGNRTRKKKTKQTHTHTHTHTHTKERRRKELSEQRARNAAHSVWKSKKRGRMIGVPKAEAALYCAIIYGRSWSRMRMTLAIAAGGRAGGSRQPSGLH